MVIGGFDKVGEEEKLRTMLHVNPYMLHLCGQEMLVPYLVGIATAPEARGQHLCVRFWKLPLRCCARRASPL